MNLYSKLNWTDEEKEITNNLQFKLDVMFLYKAKGALCEVQSQVDRRGREKYIFTI